MDQEKNKQGLRVVVMRGECGLASIDQPIDLNSELVKLLIQRALQRSEPYGGIR